MVLLQLCLCHILTESITRQPSWHQADQWLQMKSPPLHRSFGHALVLILHKEYLRSPKDFGSYFMLTKWCLIIAFHQGWLLRCLICVATQVPMLKRASHLVWCSTVAILKFLVILSLNLCFVSEVPRGSGTWMWAEDVWTMCLLAHSQTACIHLQYLGVQWHSKLSSVSMLCLQLSKQDCWWPRKAMLSLLTRICFKERKNPVVF